MCFYWTHSDSQRQMRVFWEVDHCWCDKVELNANVLRHNAALTTSSTAYSEENTQNLWFNQCQKTRTQTLQTSAFSIINWMRKHLEEYNIHLCWIMTVCVCVYLCRLCFNPNTPQEKTFTVFMFYRSIWTLSFLSVPQWNTHTSVVCAPEHAHVLKVYLWDSGLGRSLISFLIWITVKFLTDRWRMKFRGLLDFWITTTCGLNPTQF